MAQAYQAISVRVHRELCWYVAKAVGLSKTTGLADELAASDPATREPRGKKGESYDWKMFAMRLLTVLHSVCDATGSIGGELMALPRLTKPTWTFERIGEPIGLACDIILPVLLEAIGELTECPRVWKPPPEEDPEAAGLATKKLGSAKTLPKRCPTTCQRPAFISVGPSDGGDDIEGE